MEVWADIEGFEGYYQVSNLGNIRSLDRTIIQSNGQVRHFNGRVLKQKLDRYGYAVVMLRKRTEGVRKSATVHRLVAEAFIPNPDNKPTVNHKNGNKADNSAQNLEWSTRQENTAHAIRTGLIDIEHFRKDITRLANEKRKKRVMQISNGNVVAVYDSVPEAAETMKIKYPQVIRDCCRGRRKAAYGYQWKYAS
jgi:hypothetical protein